MRILSNLVETLWGQRARLSYLMLTALVLLLTLLGERDIWTQEHRWADIVSGMFYRQDFLHPYLGENNYYDKPLLSYWLIAGFAKLLGVLSAWVLRLPSALAGLLAVWSIYRLGTVVRDRSLGLLAGWLLLTTFYFLFWARTSSADMLNMAGSLFAVTWYFMHRDRPGFYAYSIFFVIVALTSLCKGLVGAVIPVIVVGVDVLQRQSWRQHLRWSLLVALVPALVLYLFPFIASAYYDQHTYQQNGLYLVYRENILRYFQPFDHVGPIYTYLIYLPVYLMPWAIFFIPALATITKRWRHLSVNSKWVAWSLLSLFLFFTLSGSRRSYYVLPMVPFAILFTADWIIGATSTHLRRLSVAAGVVSFSILLFLAVDIVPAWYYANTGAKYFAEVLKETATRIAPWEDWRVVLLDGESKLSFYLQLPPMAKHYDIKGLRTEQTSEHLAQIWPIIKTKPANTIFITRKLYVPLLQPYFVGYKIVEMPTATYSLLQKGDIDLPVAFIPVLH